MTKLENQTDSKPNPDPTVYTNEAIERAVRSERDYVDGKVEVIDTRISGIDEATRLLRSDSKEIPRIIDEKVDNLKELVFERFRSTDEKFIAIEAQRVEQKEDAKTGLDAALAAQKEAAHEQNGSNTLAINKSETSTNESISKLEDLFTTRMQALSDKYDDLKSRVDGREANRIGGQEQRIETRAGMTFIQGLIATTVIIIGLGLSAWAISSQNKSPQVIIQTVTTQITP